MPKDHEEKGGNNVNNGSHDYRVFEISVTEQLESPYLPGSLLLEILETLVTVFILESLLMRAEQSADAA